MLTVTYRCGRVIVERAQQIVPDIEAKEGIHAGAIETTDSDRLIGMAEPGDFI